MFHLRNLIRTATLSKILVVVTLTPAAQAAPRAVLGELFYAEG
jgi:hypothetical protein